MKLAGKTIVVTGAGSGIGRALVLELLTRGAKVAAVDLSEAGLAETVAEAKLADETRLTTHIANITDRAAVLALPGEIEAAIGPIDGLINNAGIIQPFVPVAELEFDAIDRMIDVSLMGTINMTKAFLPGLLARPRAHLVNVASMGGFIPFPGQTLYGEAKAGVKLLSEGIYAETQGTRVSVSVVMPGAVNTAISANSGVEMRGASDDEAAARALPAGEAARIILDGIEADRLHILVGKDAGMLWRLIRIAPAFAIRFIQKQMAKMGL